MSLYPPLDISLDLGVKRVSGKKPAFRPLKRDPKTHSTGFSTSGGKSCIKPLPLSLDYGVKRVPGFKREFNPVREPNYRPGGRRRKSKTKRRNPDPRSTRMMMGNGKNILKPLPIALDAGVGAVRGNFHGFREVAHDMRTHSTGFNTSKPEFSPLPLALDYGAPAERGFAKTKHSHRPLAHFNATQPEWELRPSGDVIRRKRRKKKRVRRSSVKFAPPGRDLTRLEKLTHTDGLPEHGTSLATYGKDILKPLPISLDYGEPVHDTGMKVEFNPLTVSPDMHSTGFDTSGASKGNYGNVRSYSPVAAAAMGARVLVHESPTSW